MWAWPVYTNFPQPEGALLKREPRVVLSSGVAKIFLAAALRAFSSTISSWRQHGRLACERDPVRARDRPSSCDIPFPVRTLTAGQFYSAFVEASVNFLID